MEDIHLQKNVSLKPYNTFGIGAQAKLFTEVDTLTRLKSLLTDKGLAQERKLILGGGSNVLFTQDFDGLVIKISFKGIEKIREDDQYVWVRVGAGEVWHDFVQYCIEKDWAGVENLSLIPGTVGAAPMQNIGAYGVEIKEVFASLEALHNTLQEVHTFTKAQCAFGYRESIFKHEVKGQYTILNVTFRLNKQPQYNIAYGAIQQTLDAMKITELSIKAISDAVIRIRSSKLPDPKKIGNAGSFFKNPTVPNTHFEKIKVDYPHMPAYPMTEETTKIPAGWLIEQCGWKGKRQGEVGVHEKQALVLVNYGAGKGAEIKQLAHEIQDSVKARFDIMLTPEVNFI